jgi:hypothetical protein
MWTKTDCRFVLLTSHELARTTPWDHAKFKSFTWLEGMRVLAGSRVCRRSRERGGRVATAADETAPGSPDSNWIADSPGWGPLSGSSFKHFKN